MSTAVKKIPRRAKPAEKPRPPRKTTTVNLDWDLVDWMNAHLPRTTTVSEFVNQALRDKIVRG